MGGAVRGFLVAIGHGESTIGQEAVSTAGLDQRARVVMGKFVGAVLVYDLRQAAQLIVAVVHPGAVGVLLACEPVQRLVTVSDALILAVARLSRFSTS